mmetsp:Transcript_5142/g.14708  ORF Transcript_5142/g.14708 Transcript_5142/m.14708 type:complete len:242 (-) Transcript_5142:1508-2233(-)
MWSSTTFRCSSSRMLSSSHMSMARWPCLFCASTLAPSAIMYSTTSVCRVSTASMTTVVPASSAALTSALPCRSITPMAVWRKRTASASGVAPVASVSFTTTLAGAAVVFHGCCRRRRIASLSSASGASPLNSGAFAGTGTFFFAATPLAASLAFADTFLPPLVGCDPPLPLESSLEALVFFFVGAGASSFSSVSASPAIVGGACGGRNRAATACSWPCTTARLRAPRSPKAAVDFASTRAP